MQQIHNKFEVLQVYRKSKW